MGNAHHLLGKLPEDHVSGIDAPWSIKIAITQCPEMEDSVLDGHSLTSVHKCIKCNAKDGNLNTVDLASNRSL